MAIAKFLTPFTGSLIFNPGGNHGLFCVQNIENMIGPPGLTALLFIVALAFLTYLSAETVSLVRKAINPVNYITNKVKIYYCQQWKSYRSNRQRRGCAC